MSHQAGTPASGGWSGSGGAGGKVTVPPALATAVTFSTLVPAGAETGTAAQVGAAFGPLPAGETALAAIGASSAAAGNAATAVRTNKRRFMSLTLGRGRQCSPQGGPLATPRAAPGDHGSVPGLPSAGRAARSCSCAR